MCTIIVAHQIHPEADLIVAANRDEFYSRRGSAPTLLKDDAADRGPRIIAGLDSERGGTWMGATERGLFAGITNQRTWRVPDRELESRGLIVRGVLEAGEIPEALAFMRSIDARKYNDFNLLFGDTEHLFIAYGRRDAAKVELVTLEPGLHVLANDRLLSPEFPKAKIAYREAKKAVALPYKDTLRSLGALLGSHILPEDRLIPAPPKGSPLSFELVRKLQTLCVHTSAYGTVSATRLAAHQGELVHYEYADGPPCKVAFEDVLGAFGDEGREAESVQAERA